MTKYPPVYSTPPDGYPVGSPEAKEIIERVKQELAPKKPGKAAQAFVINLNKAQIIHAPKPEQEKE